jgi:integrase
MSAYLDFLHTERAASSYSTTKSRADCHIFPYPLANLRVGDITSEKIQAWLGKVAGSSQDPEQRRKNLYSANKLLVILKAALNRAHAKNRSLPAEEWRAVKPFKGGVSIGRKVFLTEAESQRLVNCCDPEFRDLVIFGLFTGCRLGEAVQMKVRDFDQRLGVWDVRVGKTGPRTCTLTGAAIDLLERLVAGKPKSSLVFVRDSGEAWNKDNVQPPMRHAVKRAELDKATSYYSLRHTAISASLVAGTVPQIVAENVGTSLRMIEQHYGKFARADRRAALERGALHLELPESNITKIA